MPTNLFERDLGGKGKKVLDQENSQLIIQSLDFSQGLQSNINALQTDVNTLESEMDQAQTDINAVESDVVVLQSDVNQLQTDVNTLESEMDQAQTDINVLESEMDQVQTDINALQPLQSDVNQLQTDVNILQSEMDQAQTDINVLESEMDQAQTDINIIEADYLKASNISDAVYDQSTWNAVTTIAPSKNVVRDKFESLSSGISQSDFNAYMGIGSANALTISMIMEDGNPPAAYLTGFRSIQNAGATEYTLAYNCHLPTNWNGKKLYINKIIMGIYDADLTDYVDQIYLYGMQTHGAFTEVFTDATSKQIIEEVTYSGGSFPYDMSGYKEYRIKINCVANTAGELEVTYIKIEYYYDT